MAEARSAVPPFAVPTLLHNPRCSKSRAAKELLDARRFVYAERRYLERPLSLDELRELRVRLGRPAREWVRAGEAAFAEAGLSPASSAILAAMASRPVLIERPILILPERAAVGRPLEALAALL